jgi:hypothetical protein
MDLTIVIPAYNEKANLAQLCGRVTAACAELLCQPSKTNRKVLSTATKYEQGTGNQYRAFFHDRAD